MKFLTETKQEIGEQLPLCRKFIAPYNHRDCVNWLGPVDPPVDDK